MDYNKQELFFRRFIYIIGLLFLIGFTLILLSSLFTEPVDGFVDLIWFGIRGAIGVTLLPIIFVCLQVFASHLKGNRL